MLECWSTGFFASLQYSITPILLCCRIMTISPLINVYLDSTAKKTGLGQDTLKPGDALRLRVIEILGDHRVVADFGKFRAPAKIAFPVQRGEELMVKVVEAGRQLRLSVIQPALPGGDAGNRFPSQFKVVSDELFQQIRSVIQHAYHQTRDPGNPKNPPQSAMNTLLSEIDNQQSIAVKKHHHPELYHVLTFLLPLKDNDHKAKVKFYRCAH